MKENLKQLIQGRRTYYSLSNNCPISDEQLKDVLDFAILHVPSAYNMQSARVVLLLNQYHRKLWDITKEALKEVTPPESFERTERKIETSFAAGYGTILFYEDQEIVKGLQEKFPLYKDNFPVWSEQSSGMHQYIIWCLLEETGLGASLQHYNPLIDKKVAKEFDIPSTWKLIAQMPFGAPVEEPQEKQFNTLEGRVIIYK